MISAPELPSPRARIGSASLFPELKGSIYWGHASIAPLSTNVREAMNTCLNDISTHGAGAWATWNAQRQRLKQSLGLLLAAKPESIALVQNTSTALLAFALCFPWNRGDRILLFKGEFPANVAPWQRAAELFGLEIEFLSLEPFMQLEGPDFTEYEEALKRGARMVSASLVEFQTGFQLPIHKMAERAHEHGAAFAVDAVQGLGPMLFDASNVDFVACGGHKWLGGPEGIGFAYIHPKQVSKLRPIFSGWESLENAADFLLGQGPLRYDKPVRQTADFLEIGTLPVSLAAGLEAAVQSILLMGPGRIFAHIQRIYDRLEPDMKARGFQSMRADACVKRSGILSFRPPKDLDLPGLVSALGERGITVSHPDGYFRVAANWPNSLSEVPMFIQILDELLPKFRKEGTLELNR